MRKKVLAMKSGRSLKTVATRPSTQLNLGEDYRRQKVVTGPGVLVSRPLHGLKNEEYSLKMFFLFTRKLYLKSTKFLCSFTA